MTIKDSMRHPPRKKKVDQDLFEGYAQRPYLSHGQPRPFNKKWRMYVTTVRGGEGIAFEHDGIASEKTILFHMRREDAVRLLDHVQRSERLIVTKADFRQEAKKLKLEII